MLVAGFVLLLALAIYYVVGMGGKHTGNENKAIAQTYCGSCHLFPEPSLLDKATWERKVLPAMGAQLGLDKYGENYFSGPNSRITISNWLKILSYYQAEAPLVIVEKKAYPAPLKDWAGFSVKLPTPIQSATAKTTFIGYNGQDNCLYSADAANKLYKWNAKLQGYPVATLPSPVTSALFTPTETVLTCIGTLAPFEDSSGKMVKLGSSGQSEVATNLSRPVQSLPVDVNRDGLTDYVTCGFGHTYGGLYLLLQDSARHFHKKIIHSQAGASVVDTSDFNHDGWTDLVCLFAQGNEGIWVFVNDHKGGFTVKNILRFPPSFGSTSFQMVDFNHDGRADILYTAGDNGDYSEVTKPYHGIYIYLNDGADKFQPAFFYPMPGCMKAIAGDFRDDGHYDIAAIAFNTKKGNTYPGFLFLEQTGGIRFSVHEPPVSEYGHWLTMDVHDYDNDGKPDIALGNFDFGSNDTGAKAATPQLPFVVLKNNYETSDK